MSAEQQPSEPFKSLPAQPRRVHLHEAHTFIGPGRKVIGKIAVRTPTKREEVEARLEAERNLRARNGGEMPHDGSLLVDFATVAVLHKSTRDAEKPEAMAAFPSPGWMMEHLTADELGVLLNLVHQAKTADSPVPMVLDEDSIETMVSLLAAAHDSEAADAIVARCDRAWLESFAIVVCRKLTESRNALAAGDEDAASEAEEPDAPAL
jgi:hypothetical protein